MRAEAASETGPAADLLKLTGGLRTKVVWIRSIVNGQYQVDGGRFLLAAFQIMAFDTAEGTERVLVAGPKTWMRPLITGDGSKVVFSKREEAQGAVYVVNWDGTGMKKVTDGFAMGLWMDPKTKIQWLLIGNNYYPDSEDTKIGFSTIGVKRVQLDKPDVSVSLWSETKVNFKLFASADGTRLGSEFPWPKAGVVNLQTGTLKLYQDGCNPCIAPDNSYRFFVMQGNHTTITMFDDGAVNKRDIKVIAEPGGWSFNPNWTNDVRFLSIAGPYISMKSRMRPGGAHIHVGRFDEKFTSVESWAHVTSGAVYDCAPTAWIETPELKAATKAQGEAPTPRVETKVEEKKVETKAAGPTPEELAAWEAKLLARIGEALAGGKRPVFKADSRPGTQTVASVNSAGLLMVEVAPGMQTGMKPAQLSAGQKADLALSVLRAEVPADHSLLAFYLLLAGRKTDAGPHLTKGGDGAKRLLAMFE